MSRSRLAHLPLERLEKLFESAAREFAEHGYDRASLNRIIARADMSKSSLYYYFDDKADLFTTLVETAIAHFIRDIGGFDYEGLTAESFWPDLEAVMLKSLGFMENNAWYVRLGRLFYRMRDGGSKAPDRLFQAVEGWLSGLLRHGQGLGVVRTDLPDVLLTRSAMALAEVCDRFFVESFSAYDRTGHARLVAQQLDLFRRLLTPVDKS